MTNYLYYKIKSLSRLEQVRSMRLRFERYFSHDGSGVSQRILIKVPVHDVQSSPYEMHCNI